MFHMGFCIARVMGHLMAYLASDGISRGINALMVRPVDLQVFHHNTSHGVFLPYSNVKITWHSSWCIPLIRCHVLYLIIRPIVILMGNPMMRLALGYPGGFSMGYAIRYLIGRMLPWDILRRIQCAGGRYLPPLEWQWQGIHVLVLGGKAADTPTM